MDVIGVGALNIDKLYHVETIAKVGEEVGITSASESPGGSAANTIVGLARLGIKTGFIGKVGRDKEGDFILEDLKREGVDTGGITKSKGSTGLIIGFVDKSGERALYAYPGVNDTLRMDSSKLKYAKKAKFLHLSSFVGEKSYQAQRQLLKHIKAKISFSPGMLYARKGLKELELLIKNSEVIFLNREEVRLLTNREFKVGTEKIVNLGAKIVAVTLGKDGCYLADRDGSYFVKAYPAKVIDTTGAGDAFSAGFLYGLLIGKSTEICGKIGNKVASLCIGKIGARKGLPFKEDLELFLSKN